MAVSITRATLPNTPTGCAAVADHGFEKIYNMESGSLVDRTTEFTNGTSLPTAFAADDDYVYFGVPLLYTANTTTTTAANRDCRFVDIHVDLETVASASIAPTFQYSNGDNSWATLTVTDGTNGFTKSGTITFKRSTFPTNTAWIVATKDGAGNTIGDGTARGYVRIKRTANTLTTPPVIRTVGQGALSASTTYYYRVVNNKYTNSLTIFSPPAAEVSATTTATFRSIKVSWTNDATVDNQAVFRTPTSGDYVNNVFSSYVAERKIDVGAEIVKGGYFTYISGNTKYQDYIIDNGIGTGVTYSATYGLSKAYSNRVIRLLGRSCITIEGGDSSTPANFQNVVDADTAGSWGAFTKVNNKDSNEACFVCTDHLVFKDYFADSAFVLDQDGAIVTTNATSIVFGLNNSAGRAWTRGGTFLQTGETAANNQMTFKNTEFYDCDILDNPFNPTPITTSSRTYQRVSFGDNCKLFGTTVQANSQYESIVFSGTGMEIEDVMINNGRWGLDIASATTPTLSKVTLIGTTGYYLDPYADDTQVYANQFSFRNCLRPLYDTYVATPKRDKFVHLIDCTFDGCTPQDSVIGADSAVYREWTVELTILDSNGDPIETADVSIKDGTETVSYSLQTDSNGQISQAVKVGDYLPGTTFNATYNSKYANTITLYDDFTIQISKSGYQTYTLPPMTIDEPKNLILKLKPQKKVATDDMGEVYINLDKEDVKDTLNIIKV